MLSELPNKYVSTQVNSLIVLDEWNWRIWFKYTARMSLAATILMASSSLQMLKNEL